MKNIFTLVFTLFTALLMGQDYVMYETHTLVPKPGHLAALGEEIAEHNKLYHADGPYGNTVYSVMNGPNTGNLIFVMGPCTFSQLDDRPSSPEHNKDWQGVLMHSKRVEDVAYWRKDDNLSYTPATIDDSAANMLMVRFFKVADNALFNKVQRQIVAVRKANKNPKQRIMYQRQFAHSDGQDWAIVIPYKNWSEYDTESTDFKEAFIAVHGAKSWATFGKDFDAAVISRDDEFREILHGLSGN